MSNFKKLADAMSFSTEKMRKNGIFETERFFCDTYCFEPGQEQKPHTHADEDKIYYVLEGRGSFSVGSEGARTRRRGNRLGAGRAEPWRRQSQQGAPSDPGLRDPQTASLKL